MDTEETSYFRSPPFIWPTCWHAGACSLWRATGGPCVSTPVAHDTSLNGPSSHFFRKPHRHSLHRSAAVICVGISSERSPSGCALHLPRHGISASAGATVHRARHVDLALLTRRTGTSPSPYSHD